MTKPFNLEAMLLEVDLEIAGRREWLRLCGPHAKRRSPNWRSGESIERYRYRLQVMEYIRIFLARQRTLQDEKNTENQQVR